jgi:spore germination protein (amino acid permease)
MDKLTSKHLMFIIWGTTIVSIKTNLNIFVKDAGRDTWIAVIVSSLLIFLYLMYTINACVKGNDFNLVNIYNRALGKRFSKIFLLLLILNLFFTLVESASVEASAMHINVFLETPPWYLILFFVIPAIYTVRSGVVPVITVTIIGVILAMIAGINLVMLTAKYKEYKYLLPILAEGITPGFIAAVLKSLGLYGSLLIMYPYFGYIQETKKIKFHAALGLLFVMQMHIVAMTGAISSFGPVRTQLLAYPKLTQTQQISLFGFLESGEFFVMFQIIGGWFVKYVLTFHAIMKLLEDMDIKNNLIIYGISAVVLLSSYFVSSNLFRLSSMLNYYSYLSLVNFIIIPFCVFTIFKFKKKKKDGEDNQPKDDNGNFKDTEGDPDNTTKDNVGKNNESEKSNSGNKQDKDEGVQDTESTPSNNTSSNNSIEPTGSSASKPDNNANDVIKNTNYSAEEKKKSDSSTSDYTGRFPEY